MEVNKDKYSFEEIEAEQREIEECYLGLRFAQKIRKDSLGCYKKCGQFNKYPFNVEPDMLLGKQELCFGDCLNLNWEKGPYLRELGSIPEDAIPKKFIWPHSL